MTRYLSSLNALSCRNPIAFRVEFWSNPDDRTAQVADILMHKDSPLETIREVWRQIPGAIVRRVDRVGTPF